MFGIGNFLRVGYILMWMSNAEQWAMMGMGGGLKIVLIVQSVLGAIILAHLHLERQRRVPVLRRRHGDRRGRQVGH